MASDADEVFYEAPAYENGSAYSGKVVSDTAEIASARTQKAEVKKVYCDYSLGFFSKSNKLRHACIRLVESTAFEVVIILAIVLNCTFLALTEPTKEAGVVGTSWSMIRKFPLPSCSSWKRASKSLQWVCTLRKPK